MSREWIRHSSGSWHTITEAVKLFLADGETYISRPRNRHFNAINHDGHCWTLYEHRYGGGKKNETILVCTGLKSLKAAQAALAVERPPNWWVVRP